MLISYLLVDAKELNPSLGSGKEVETASMISLKSKSVESYYRNALIQSFSERYPFLCGSKSEKSCYNSFSVKLKPLRTWFYSTHC